jgi:hypothetical protein
MPEALREDCLAVARICSRPGLFSGRVSPRIYCDGEGATGKNVR